MDKEKEEKDFSLFGDTREKELCEDSTLHKFLEDIPLFRAREDGTREYRILVIDDVEIKGKKRTISYVSASGALDLVREAKKTKTEHELGKKLSEWVEKLCESPDVDKSVIEPYKERLQGALKNKGDMVLFVGGEYKSPIALISLDELTDKWDFGRKMDELMSHLEAVLTKMSDLHNYYIKKQEDEKGEQRAEVRDKEIEEEEITKEPVVPRERADVVVMAAGRSKLKRVLSYSLLAIVIAGPAIAYFKVPLIKSGLAGIFSSFKQSSGQRTSGEEAGLLTEDEDATAREAEDISKPERKKPVSGPSAVAPSFRDKIESESSILSLCASLCRNYPQVGKYRDRAIDSITRFERMKNSPEYKKLSENRKENIETLILNAKQACEIPY
jgi:hypothetical protein